MPSSILPCAGAAGRASPTCAASLVLAVCLACAGTARADDVDAITPYRPTVSNPAQLPVPGQLEAELGGLRARSSDGSRRGSIPYLLKLGFDKEWGVLLGGEAYVRQDDDSGRAQGVGDASVTLKRAWTVDDATAFGAELGVKLPTANDRIGSGKADYTLNAIFSRDIGAVHLDTNLNATRLGAPDDGTGRTQIGASASLSTPLSEHWGVTGELSGTRHAGEEHGSQVLAAVTYSPTKRLTFDFGLARAWRPAPATTQVFAGVVLPLAKLW